MERRSVPVYLADNLPIQIETIGINADQESIERTQGYPYYHFLISLKGEGEWSVKHQTWKMSEGSAILIAPHIPHRYEAKSGSHWLTGYITFHGSMAEQFIEALQWKQTEHFKWELSNARIVEAFERLLTSCELRSDPSGWQASADLYYFLSLIRTDARTESAPSMSKRLQKLQVVLDYLEQNYANPDLGLSQMAALLSISERQLNENFRALFGQTAYQYLIQLRMRKAKQFLPSYRNLSILNISEMVGYRDVSHFVATFRQKVGTTPELYRRLYHSEEAPELAQAVKLEHL